MAATQAKGKKSTKSKTTRGATSGKGSKRSTATRSSAAKGSKAAPQKKRATSRSAKAPAAAKATKSNRATTATKAAVRNVKRRSETAQETDAETIQVDRRLTAERRSEAERRQSSDSVPVERRQSARRKVPRRRQIDPTTCERDYSQDEIEFMHALDAYKRANGRMFPTCSEILEVIRDLGYQRVAESRSTSNSSATDAVEMELVSPGVSGEAESASTELPGDEA